MIPRRFLSAYTLLGALCISFTLFSLWNHVSPPTPPTPPATAVGETASQTSKLPKYKDWPKEKTYPPIEDNWPLAQGFKSRKDFPDIPSWNRPPKTHITEKTPIFIGFTRNWPLLQQVVVSYIVAGWPPEDIYVVENTGTFHSNKLGHYTLQNPFFLNHTRLDLFGVNILITPTLLTFAQLQTYFLFTAYEKGWGYYFWSHMDIIAQTEEKLNGSLYQRASTILQETLSPDYLLDKVTGKKQDWSIRFFAYDWLALNNVETFMKVGGWDTFISYYTSDCDMHGRFSMAGIKMEVADAGLIKDVGIPIDLNLLFRKKIDPTHPPKTSDELNALTEDVRGGEGYDKLIEEIEKAVEEKKSPDHIRNSWQGRQTGGKGEPFYREPHGFQDNMERVVQCGIQSYHEKWGYKGCNLNEAGRKLEEAWLLNHDEHFDDP